MSSPGPAATVVLTAAGFAYLRGLIHAADFDHISMIDNSVRKLLAEERQATTVGLAFSAGHSTVVLLTGLVVIASSSIAAALLDRTTDAALVLSLVGLGASGLYLLLLALNNATLFVAGWRARRGLRSDQPAPIPDRVLYPRGVASRLLTRPLARVRGPRHIFAIGFLFGLGFDTASTVGLMMVGAAAAAGGANAIALLALPVMFAAAMTLGDTVNNLMMLKIYNQQGFSRRAHLTYNLVATGLGLISAVIVVTLAACEVLKLIGSTVPVVAQVAEVDIQYVGYVLIGAFAVIGAIGWLRAGPLAGARSLRQR